MTIEDELKQYIIMNFGSITKFCKEINMSQSTLSTIFKRGIQRTSIKKIFAICDGLGISADALAEGRIITKEEYNKTDMELSQALRFLDYSYYLGIDKQRLNPDELDFLQNNMELLIEMLRKKRSEDK